MGDESSRRAQLACLRDFQEKQFMQLLTKYAGQRLGLTSPAFHLGCSDGCPIYERGPSGSFSLGAGGTP